MLETSGVLAFRDLIIDVDGWRVLLRGKPVDLTRIEFQILVTLASRPRRVVAHEELLEHLWGPGWFGDDNNIAVHISKIRGKLGESGISPRYLRTVRGVGYRFEPDPPATKEAWMASGEGTHGLVATLLNDPDHRIKWASHSIRDLLGWNPSDLIGIRVHELIHPEDLDAGLAELPAMTSGSLRVVELRTKTASGAYVPVAHAVQPIMTTDGTVAGFLGELHSVSTASSMPPGPTTLTEPGSPPPPTRTVTLTYDQDFTLVDIDPRVPICDWQPDEIIGRYFSPADRDEATVRSMVGTIVAAGVRETKGVINIRCKDGSLHPAQSHAYMFVNEDGDFDGYRVTLEIPETGNC